MARNDERLPDPSASLALLWRTREREARKGRDLSVGTIVAAATEIADEAGLDAVSMRGVADRLGVAPMTLYTHVPGKAELLDLMVDAAYQEPAPGPARRPRGWRAGLEAVARENLRRYGEHPWLARASLSRPPLGPGVIAKYEAELGVLDGCGLSDVEMDAVVSLVNDFVRSAAAAAVAADRARSDSGLTDEQWWRAHEPHFERVFDAERFPLAARVGAAAGAEHGSAYDPLSAFEFGLRCILDGVDSLVRRARE